jgi:hypothetical protein
MKTRLLFIIVLMIALISACVPTTPGVVIQPMAVPPTLAPTNTPAVITPPDTPTAPAPTQIPTMAPTEISLVVKTFDNRILVVNAAVPLGSAYTPAFTDLDPKGGVIGGIPYVYDFTTFPTVMAVQADGPYQQEFVQNPTYGLAVWNGEQPRSAWGTLLAVPNTPSKLVMSAPDGGQLVTLMTQGASDPAVQDVALRWSADGKSLYFSREPVGIGGYFVFTGISSLYKMDIASKKVTDLLPLTFPSGSYSCLDAISLDYRYVADHCSPDVITIHDLSSGATTTIQPPKGLTGYRLLGSTRFSPDGSRVAFGLAKSDPNAEQGWVGVSDGLEGVSKLILTSEIGYSYTVVGWLNDQTLLLQSNPAFTTEGKVIQLWSVNVDGSNLTKIVDGSFLAVMDGR